jgi:ElaB/YqjD/DUF883 family membrane-anchored ribosome-binding protein
MFSEARAQPDPATGNGFHFAALGANAGAATQAAQKRLREAEEYIKNLVTARPGMALAAALAAGVVIGWLIKRR